MWGGIVRPGDSGVPLRERESANDWLSSHPYCLFLTPRQTVGQSRLRAHNDNTRSTTESRAPHLVVLQAPTSSPGADQTMQWGPTHPTGESAKEAQTTPSELPTPQ